MLLPSTAITSIVCAGKKKKIHFEFHAAKLVLIENEFCLFVQRKFLVLSS